MSCRYHNISLIFYDALLIVFSDEMLVDELHCIEFAILLESHEENLGEAASANTLYDVEAPHIYSFAVISEERF